MTYQKQNFQDGRVLSASQLNTIEQGIVDNENAIAQKQDKGDYVTKTEANNAYASKGDTYTKTEVDNKIANAGSGGSVADSKIVDLVIFMGQSNMAGRGVASQAPVVPEGQGYEFRAISDPTKLYPIIEPFGVNENNEDSGVSENSKTGSMVSAIALEYFKRTNVPIVGISCAQGGTEINWWFDKPLQDAVARHNKAKEWLLGNGYTIRNDFMVWCQGESDGRLGTSIETYNSKLQTIIDTMVANGVQKCFVIRIGNHRDEPLAYDTIIKAQTVFCQNSDVAIMASCMLAGFAEQGLMKDTAHFTQPAYNFAGAEVGKNMAFYVNNGIEPYMYDSEYKCAYIPYGGISVESDDVLVDTSLNINSINPVQNKVITSQINALYEYIDSVVSGTSTKYSVTYNLNDVNSSSSMIKVVEGASFETLLSVAEDMVLSVVAVTMGGVDITAQCYSDGRVYIQSVNGDIVITASAIEYELVFDFNTPVENGIDMSSVGVVADGKITLVTPADKTSNALELLEPISLSPDKSFTIEIISNGTSNNGIVLANKSSNSGAFVNVKSLNEAATFRFRDFAKTLSVRFGDQIALAGKHHHAIVYDASTKTFKGYIDGVELETTFETGNANTFKAFDLTHIFGGYRSSSSSNYNDFVGELYYVRYKKKALSPSEFHLED